MSEQQISYTHSNTYSTLNRLSKKTKNVWMAFHGMGHLSRYFIKHFECLNAEENYIIAPQAPSKYYQDKRFKYVGASWLTKENTAIEKENVLRYIDAVWEHEKKQWQGLDIKVILIGYSQGVSIVSRWAAKGKIQCEQLVLHSGGIPVELTPAHFNYLNTSTKVLYLYGNKDQYFNEARNTEEQLKGNRLFGDRLEVKVFNGIHEVSEAEIQNLVTS